MIELKNLSKVYKTSEKEIVALDGINLTIQDGEIFGIIGLSGAGKSTLVRCINLLERPTGGEVIIDGKSLTELDAENAKRARYYNYYTGRTWGDGRNYDLVVNTSKEPLEKIADAIVSYIKTVRA